MIEAEIETRASPERVWRAWEVAHQMQEGFDSGKRGVLKTGGGRFAYRVLNVEKGRSFRILWKTFFTRLEFSHFVIPAGLGAKICYQVEIRGFFAWPMRWFLKDKIRNNLRLVLKSLATQLEDMDPTVSKLGRKASSDDRRGP